MKSRPRDARGYPIPYQQARAADGTPDFRTLDTHKTAECVREKRCGMCGRRLKGDVAFIGGPLCYVNRMFLDAAMHYAGAVYAMTTCPHLSSATGRYAAPRPSDAVGRRTIELASGTKVDRFMIGRNTGFGLVTHQGEVLIKAEPWLSVEWWRNGGQIG